MKVKEIRPVYRNKSNDKASDSKGSCHYVLMADMINSSQYKLDTLELFRATIDTINKKFDLISPLTITLGDEFQGIVNSLEQAVSIMFAIERALIADGYPFQLRYALGYGHILTPINSKIAHGMYGEALTNTRKLLENSKGDKRKRFDFLLPDTDFEDTLTGLFDVYQSFLDNWNDKDFPLIDQFYENEDYKIVAKELGKRKDQIWKREKNLRIRAFFSQQKSIVSLAKYYDISLRESQELNKKFAKDVTKLIVESAKAEVKGEDVKEIVLKNIIINYFRDKDIMNLIKKNLNSLLKK